MKISSFIRSIKERNALLYYTGLIQLGLFILSLLFYSIDDRQVLGLNPWIKPMKFELSIFLYVWTIGWLLNDLKPSFHKWIRPISITIALTMMLEIGIIIGQSTRATRSHFNVDTSLDSILFMLMGIAIAMNTVIMVILFLFFLRRHNHLSPDYLVAVRLSMLIFLAGNYIGGMMIQQGSHSIGVPDGGPGISFFNWSTEAGDLRIAHFLALHSIQILPLMSYLLKKITTLTLHQRLLLIVISFMIYSVFLGTVYFKSLEGHSFF